LGCGFAAPGLCLEVFELPATFLFMNHFAPSKQGMWLIAGLLSVAILATSPFWLFLLTAKRNVKPLPKLVAILPLPGETDPGKRRIFEQFARVLTEKVSKPRQLEAVPYGRVHEFSNSSDLRSIGAALGVDYLVLGKIASNDDRTYIQLYLVTPQRPSLPSWMNLYELPVDRSQSGSTSNIPDALLDKIAADLRAAASTALR
jgi:TolB-like protein